MNAGSVTDRPVYGLNRVAHASQFHREAWVVRAAREPSSLTDPKPSPLDHVSYCYEVSSANFNGCHSKRSEEPGIFCWSVEVMAEDEPPHQIVCLTSEQAARETADLSPLFSVLFLFFCRFPPKNRMSSPRLPNPLVISNIRVAF